MSLIKMTFACVCKHTLSHSIISPSNTKLDILTNILRITTPKLSFPFSVSTYFFPTLPNWTKLSACHFAYYPNLFYYFICSWNCSSLNISDDNTSTESPCYMLGAPRLCLQTFLCHAIIRSKYLYVHYTLFSSFIDQSILTSKSYLYFWIII